MLRGQHIVRSERLAGRHTTCRRSRAVVTQPVVTAGSQQAVIEAAPVHKMWRDLLLADGRPKRAPGEAAETVTETVTNCVFIAARFVGRLRGPRKVHAVEKCWNWCLAAIPSSSSSTLQNCLIVPLQSRRIMDVPGATAQVALSFGTGLRDPSRLQQAGGSYAPPHNGDP